jgi:zeaxanthin glucosyltransferase
MPLFEAVAEATAELDVQLVISFGGQRPSKVPQFAGDPVVLDIAPQLEILEKAAVMVTHAGLNSALECLAAGVPMVAIPITNDQPGVSSRIVWTGTGVQVLLEACTRDTLRTAIAEVLGNPSYRQAAQRFRRSIAATDGLARAADIVEQALQSGLPAVRA